MKSVRITSSVRITAAIPDRAQRISSRQLFWKRWWEHLKEVIWYVGHSESHFGIICETKLKSESKEILRARRRQLEKDDKRIAELDRLFIRLYEDNVASRISDDRFAMMSGPMKMGSAN